MAHSKVKNLQAESMSANVAMSPLLRIAQRTCISPFVCERRSDKIQSLVFRSRDITAAASLWPAVPSSSFPSKPDDCAVVALASALARVRCLNLKTFPRAEKWDRNCFQFWSQLNHRRNVTCMNFLMTPRFRVLGFCV